MQVFLHNPTIKIFLLTTLVRKLDLRGMIMLFMDIGDLEEKIHQGKKKLQQIVKGNGLNSPEALDFSQKLDQLILRYQIYLQQKNHKNYQNFSRTKKGLRHWFPLLKSGDFLKKIGSH